MGAREAQLGRDIYIHIADPPPHSHPSRSSQSNELSYLCYTATSHWLSVLHMVVYICQCQSLSWFPPLLTLLCPQVHFLYLCLCLSSVGKFISAIYINMLCLVAQSCSYCSLQGSSGRDCILPGSSAKGFSTSILEWVSMPFSRVSSQTRDQTQVFHIAGSFFTV